MKNAIETCQECRRKFTSNAAGQIMAPILKVRRTRSIRALGNIGIDYAGPYETKQERGRQRATRCLCFFTCLATRGTNLEITYSMDTDHFLMQSIG